MNRKSVFYFSPISIFAVLLISYISLAEIADMKPTETHVQNESEAAGLEQKNVIETSHAEHESVQTFTPAPAEPVRKEPIVPERYCIDEIRVVIYTQDGSEFITQSEITRPSLEGASRTLDDLIFERLLYLDAKKYKMQPDEDTIDKHLATVQQQNNLSRDEMLAVFRSAGYDYEQGRRQLGMLFAINSIIDFKVRSRLIVPERDVIAYYEAHSVMLEPAYLVQRAVVPYSTTKTMSELKKRLKQILAGAGSLTISWEQPFWIDQSEVSDAKQFIRSMSIGAISEPQEMSQGFEIFKLVDKKAERSVPLEDRYREISDILRKPKFQELMDAYKNKLYQEASILYVDSKNPKAAEFQSKES